MDDANGDVLVIAPNGRLDTSAARAFEQDVMAAVDRPAAGCVIDFSAVEYISSAGLRVVLMAAKRMRAAGRHFGVCVVRPAVHEVFVIAGLDAIIPAFPTLADALAARPRQDH